MGNSENKSNIINPIKHNHPVNSLDKSFTESKNSNSDIVILKNQSTNVKKSLDSYCHVATPPLTKQERPIRSDLRVSTFKLENDINLTKCIYANDYLTSIHFCFQDGTTEEVLKQPLKKIHDKFKRTMRLGRYGDIFYPHKIFDSVTIVVDEMLYLFYKRSKHKRLNPKFIYPNNIHICSSLGNNCNCDRTLETYISDAATLVVTDITFEDVYNFISIIVDEADKRYMLKPHRY